MALKANGGFKSGLYGMVDVWLPALPVVIANLLHHIFSKWEMTKYTDEFYDFAGQDRFLDWDASPRAHENQEE